VGNKTAAIVYLKSCISRKLSECDMAFSKPGPWHLPYNATLRLIPFLEITDEESIVSFMGDCNGSLNLPGFNSCVLSRSHAS
jgi:hypothetical protein